MSDYLARVAARAQEAKADRAVQWRDLQAKAPALAAFATDLAKHTDKLQGVTHDGIRYGDPPLERNVPPVPGRRA